MPLLTGTPPVEPFGPQSSDQLESRLERMFEKGYQPFTDKRHVCEHPILA